VTSSIWTNYGSLLISGGEDFKIKMWDIRLGNPLVYSIQCNSHVVSLSLTLDDQLLASGSLDGSVSLFAQKSSVIDNSGNLVYKLNQVTLSEVAHSIR